MDHQNFRAGGDRDRPDLRYEVLRIQALVNGIPCGVGWTRQLGKPLRKKILSFCFSNNIRLKRRTRVVEHHDVILFLVFVFSCSPWPAPLTSPRRPWRAEHCHTGRDLWGCRKPGGPLPCPPGDCILRPPISVAAGQNGG